MTMPPITPQSTAPEIPASPGTHTPADPSTAAAEFRAALATALGEARPGAAKRPRIAREGVEPVRPRTPMITIGTRGAGTEVKGVDAAEAQTTDAAQQGVAGAAPAVVPAAPDAEFAPIDLASFLTSGTPDEGKGTSPADASKDGVATAPELTIDLSGIAPVVVGAPANATDVKATTPATQTTLDPRQMPSIGAMLPERASETAEVRREMRGLVPQFGDRLQRVIDRMEQEFGYTIEVVETVRTQERQDALFAQGRTQPGPVVTWTRNSNHTAGLAADVTVNGGWTDRAGFEQLARVAREEGLRTLWPRDPGHIELVTPTLGEERVAQSAPSIMPVAGEAKILPWPPRGPEPQRDAHIQPWVPTPDGEARIQPWVPQDGEAKILPFNPEGDARILPFNPERVRAGSPELGQKAEGRTPPPGLTRVASVARVADVAKVADVARVATVGTPGTAAANIVVDTPAAGGLERPVLARGRRQQGTHVGAAAPTTGSSATTASPVMLATDAAATSERGAGQQERGGKDSREGQRAAVDAIREADTALMRAAIGGDTAGERRAGESLVPVAGMERTDAAERIARVLRVQESMAERPMSSVLLRLDHPDGGEDRIRVDLRGTTVGATLDVRDAAAADNLRAHATELQAQLGRHGLEGDAIAVRTMTRGSDAALTVAGAAVAEREGIRAGNAGNTGNSGTNQGSRDPRAAREEANARGQDQPSSRQKRDQRGQR